MHHNTSCMHGNTYYSRQSYTTSHTCLKMKGYRRCAACSTYYGILQQAVLVRVLQPQQPAAAAQQPPQLIILAIVIRLLSASLSVPARASCASGEGVSSPSSRASTRLRAGPPGPAHSRTPQPRL